MEEQSRPLADHAPEVDHIATIEVGITARSERQLEVTIGLLGTLVGNRITSHGHRVRRPTGIFVACPGDREGKF